MVVSKNDLAMIPALRDMMRPPRHDYTSNASHHSYCFACPGFITRKVEGHW
jgi:hypothetical protein